MKNKILFVSFSEADLAGYRSCFQELFFDEDITVEYESLVSLHKKRDNLKDIDIALVTIDDAKRYIQFECRKQIPVIYVNHTLEISFVDQLLEITRKKRISIVSETMLYSENQKKMLISMGVPEQCLSAWAPRLGEEKLEENLLLFEEVPIKSISEHSVLRPHSVGRGLIALDSLVWILTGLKRLDLLQKPVIQAYFQKVVPIINHSVFEMNSTDYYLHAHDKSNQNGCMLFAEDRIWSVNEGAEALLGKKAEEFLGNTIFECFPFLRDYENKLDQFGERVINWSGRQIIMDLWRNKSHGTYSGYITFADYVAETKKELRLRKQLNEKNNTAKYYFSMIQGKSKKLGECIRIAKRIARSDASVLITGPSGSGKELFAQSIHNASSRNSGPFISVNCGALTDSLLESELFGYESGAFTGAKKEGHMGLFEQAHNGTLFLDEVGDMPAALQVKLLRVLQEQEVVRVGGTKVISVNVRIIAATNKDLKEMVHGGQFRLDLYYRLNVLPLRLPGLNERREDIKDIFEHLKRLHHCEFILSEEAVKTIIQHNYEGNVRELQNLVEYLGSLGQYEIQKADLPYYFLEEDDTSVSLQPDKIQLEEYVPGQEEKLIFSQVLLMNKRGKGAGRRSLRLRLAEQKICFSEDKIRNILLSLERKGYVEIRKGRGGVWALRDSSLE